MIVKTYFIEKVGVYGHGVFWIGTDCEAAIEECKRLALIECDSHHVFIVCEFGLLNASKLPNGSGKAYHNYDIDAEHKEIFRGEKQRCPQGE